MSWRRSPPAVEVACSVRSLFPPSRLSYAGVVDMDRRSLRRWLNARRAAEAREQAELRDAHPSPAEALRRALHIIAFAGRRHGWPLPDDPRSLHEDRLGYGRSGRLRAAWRHDGGRLH